MAKSPISNDLLKTTVGIHVEAGVSASRIRALINQFASEQPRHEIAADIAGFLSVEDIPQARREGFLWVISSLSRSPSRDLSEAP